ncbi:Hypothetical Protein FCC1311_058312 [Hondaea fermentalgiana]|uniref:SAP domain-containing protein n=1 Tax=Hondaea fermentalgiana TaxID=2315210 RepID=A0A2R5GFA8_9STRA|nr:Hypothetical Protein FCC1311_058312 [Hondaea fermentalgiana]|eukprot:GBG29610.1 Hypothetical Protein FCC1311_058312 [Hondaea fermentalgiana]
MQSEDAGVRADAERRARGDGSVQRKWSLFLKTNDLFKRCETLGLDPQSARRADCENLLENHGKRITKDLAQKDLWELRSMCLKNKLDVTGKRPALEERLHLFLICGISSGTVASLIEKLYGIRVKKPGRPPAPKVETGRDPLLTIPASELRSMLTERGLPTYGTKPVLVDRLRDGRVKRRGRPPKNPDTVNARLAHQEAKNFLSGSNSRRPSASSAKNVVDPSPARKRTRVDNDDITQNHYRERDDDDDDEDEEEEYRDESDDVEEVNDDDEDDDDEDEHDHNEDDDDTYTNHFNMSNRSRSSASRSSRSKRITDDDENDDDEHEHAGDKTFESSGGRRRSEYTQNQDSDSALDSDDASTDGEGATRKRRKFDGRDVANTAERSRNRSSKDSHRGRPRANEKDSTQEDKVGAMPASLLGAAKELVYHMNDQQSLHNERQHHNLNSNNLKQDQDLGETASHTTATKARKQRKQHPLLDHVAVEAYMRLYRRRKCTGLIVFSNDNLIKAVEERKPISQIESEEDALAMVNAFFRRKCHPFLSRTPDVSWTKSELDAFCLEKNIRKTIDKVEVLERVAQFAKSRARGLYSTLESFKRRAASWVDFAPLVPGYPPLATITERCRVDPVSAGRYTVAMEGVAVDGVLIASAPDLQRLHQRQLGWAKTNNANSGANASASRSLALPSANHFGVFEPSVAWLRAHIRFFGLSHFLATRALEDASVHELRRALEQGVLLGLCLEPCADVQRSLLPLKQVFAKEYLRRMQKMGLDAEVRDHPEYGYSRNASLFSWIDARREALGPSTDPIIEPASPASARSQQQDDKSEASRRSKQSDDESEQADPDTARLLELRELTSEIEIEPFLSFHPPRPEVLAPEDEALVSKLIDMHPFSS